MRVILCLLVSAVCVLADKNGTNNRRTKPFVADAVGNTLPPPSNMPATVGSPIGLLTPDKYEFYTFDESGELVKRLMTLQEIQAIVAAGEDSEGLVTFANENQPTMAFNFSQAPYTKVHSVVTNVQNVLKAQMEAHKNKPPVKPTLDTPDVSDTWSLILPSIFGNSGVDILPDKAASSFTPETETIESLNKDDVDNSLSKEGGVQISSLVTGEKIDDDSKTTTTETVKTNVASSTTTSTTTTENLTTTKKITTKTEPPSTTTVRNKLLTTTRPRTTTTKLPTTIKATVTLTTKRTTTTTTPKPTTTIPTTTTTTSTAAPTMIEYISNDIPTAKPVTEFERISTFIPISTVKYVTERTTEKLIDSTKAPFVYAPTTKKSPSSINKSPRPISSTEIPRLQTTPKISTPLINKVYFTAATKHPELERVNLTTLTTQSVSPSTTVSSTEFLSIEHSQHHFADHVIKDDDSVIPLFDVAQSISQIASDLGNNYQPIPTSSNLLDTTKVNENDMESKEDLEMDILSYNQKKTEDNFVKISTIDPHPQEKGNEKETDKKQQTKSTTEAVTTTEHVDLTTGPFILSESTTIDPILTESMEDLISQVVNEAPESVVDFENNKDTTTEKEIEITTAPIATELTTDISIVKNITLTTENIIIKQEKEESIKVSSDNEVLIKVTSTTESTTPATITTEKPVTTKAFSDKPNIVTTEKIIVKKNTTKIFSHNSNKLNSEIKNNEKDDDSKDFIKISVSTFLNSTNNEPTKDSSTDGKFEDKENNSDKNIALQKHEIKVVTKPIVNSVGTTTTPKIESNTKPVAFSNIKDENVTVSQSSENKTLTDKKSSLNIKKDKLPDNLPKVEEFKKKIQKVNDEELANDRNEPWKLIPTVTPPKGNEISKDKYKPDPSSNDEYKNVLLEFSKENQGLEVTTKDLGEDIAQFTELCNELAFRYWNKVVENTDKKRSFVLSPYSITSMLAMMFMGAKGATSGEMNEILKLDDMVTFNPHFTLKNISDSIDQATNSGIAVSAFARELFSDRNKGKILTFYKERAQHFYSGHVEEINFKLISDIIRRRTNLLVKKHTWGKIPEFMKMNSIVMKPPLAAFSANIFQTDCTGTSVDGRDGEMYFVVSPNVRQRRLVPVPAVVYKSGYLAGYDPVLDATAAALGNTNSIVSTIFLMPGQQGNIVHADDLEKLENRLLESDPAISVWGRVLRTLLPRVGLELQIPRFAHKSVFNVSSTLREMGLKELFDAEHADLGGLNGPSKDLYLSDMIQLTSFVTCGEGLVDEQHHIEDYPETLTVARRRTSRWADWDEPRDYQRAFHDPHDVGEAMHLPLHLRPRQARVPTRIVQSARLKFDRPFLFFVRHNPSGMILYVGRYNPRLLP